MLTCVKLPIASLFFFILTLLPLKGFADLIILKDGTRVEAEEIWEENEFIRFSIPNYDGIVITYSKEIVERIVRKDTKIDNNMNATNDKGDAISHKGTELSSTNQIKESFSSPGYDEPRNQMEKNQTPTDPEPEIDMAVVESVSGILFYSARRSYKYQTGPDDRFHTFKEAVDDLAAKFNKDPYWIGQNLGNTNDLGKIYINLSRPIDKVGADTDTALETTGILFYDPRRTYKYWVSSESKHDTLDEAIETLANQYARSTEWVINHLGETNDLSEIHRNLEAGLKSEVSP